MTNSKTSSMVYNEDRKINIDNRQIYIEKSKICTDNSKIKIYYDDRKINIDNIALQCTLQCNCNVHCNVHCNANARYSVQKNKLLILVLDKPLSISIKPAP